MLAAPEGADRQPHASSNSSVGTKASIPAREAGSIQSWTWLIPAFAWAQRFGEILWRPGERVPIIPRRAAGQIDRNRGSSAQCRRIPVYCLACGIYLRLPHGEVADRASWKKSRFQVSAYLAARSSIRGPFAPSAIGVLRRAA